MLLPAALRRWRSLPTPDALLLLSGGVTVLLVLLAAMLLLLARGDIRRDADKDAGNIARAAAQSIAGHLALYDQALRGIARQLEAPGVMALDPQLRQALLFGGAPHDASFGFINGLDARGDVIADSESVLPRTGNFASRDYFRAQRERRDDRLFLGDVFDKTHGVPQLIALSRRISKADGSFAGVVVGSVQLGWLAGIFGRFSIGTRGSITLLDDSGTILQRVPAAPNEIGHRPSLATLPLGEPVGPLDAADPVDLRPRRFVLHRVAGLPLTVAVGLAPEDIYAAWNRRAAGILSAVAVLGALSLVLLLLLRRALRRQAKADTRLREQALELRDLARCHSDSMASELKAHGRRVETLAAISHEFRTLLYGVLADAARVRDAGPLAPEQARRLESLENTGGHLRELTERFLRDAQEAEGEPALELRPTDIRAVVARCGRMVGVKADIKGLQLSLAVDPALPARMVTDQARLELILTNLLDNAIKYTDCGSVALHASMDAGRLRVLIADTGRGMTEAQRRRLRPDPAVERPSRSAGSLGLSIVTRETGLLGGSIGYLPNPGGGSIIIVEIPAPPEPPEDVPQAPPAGEALDVLVVDDSGISREATAGHLQAAGQRVVQAASGEQALDLVRTRRFDVVLLDQRMDGISGMETARRIRSLDLPAASVPIVLLTAELGMPHADALQACGIRTCLTKPVTQARLLEAIRGAGRRAAANDGAGSGEDPAAQARRQAASRRQLALFAQQLETLLPTLEHPDTDAGSWDKRLHALTGDAGQIGWTALAETCRRVMRAKTAERTAEQALSQAVRTTLEEVRQRLQPPSSGAPDSAIPI